MHFQIIDVREKMAARQRHFDRTGYSYRGEEMTETGNASQWDDDQYAFLDAEATNGFAHDYIGAGAGIDYELQAR